MFEEINKDEDYYRSKKKSNPRDRLQNRNKNGNTNKSKKQGSNKKQKNPDAASRTKRIKKPNKNRKF